MTVEIDEVEGKRCPRCGAPVPVKRTGRPATWCSQKCRRAASEEKRAGDRGAIAKEVVQQVQVLQPVLRCGQCYSHDDGERCVHAVTGSPESIAYVLENLRVRAAMGALDDAERWGAVVVAADVLAVQIEKWRAGTRGQDGPHKHSALTPDPIDRRLRTEQGRKVVRVPTLTRMAIVADLEEKGAHLLEVPESKEHDLQECARRVLASPTASALVVDDLVERLFGEKRGLDPRWSRAVNTFAAFARVAPSLLRRVRR